MRIVTAQELECWLATGEVVEKDSRGAKVIVLADGTFLKIFHTRHHPVLARLRPPAQRFARNAEILNKAGVATPQIKELCWVDKTNGISGCIYQPLPGKSLETIHREIQELTHETIKKLALFIKSLHKSGIYFRSLHLGNILQLDNGNFGLIDFLDLSFKRRPLNKWEIKRNLAHLSSYLKRRKIKNFPTLELKECYEAAE